MYKFNYKINSKFYQPQLIEYLMPSSLHEVVPGESWNGSFKWKYLSSPTSQNLLNDIYCDHYLFYVPWRLVWPEWINFITKGDAGNQDTTTVPTQTPILSGLTATDPDEAVANLNYFFCKQKVINDSGSNYAVNALPIWCYYLIWNTYFRASWQGVQAYPTADVYLLGTRHSLNNFHTRALDQTVTPDNYSIGTTTDSVREAFADEQFARLRGFYGDKYTDYLRALGIVTGKLFGRVLEYGSC